MNPPVSTALTEDRSCHAMGDFRRAEYFYSTGPNSFGESGFNGGNSVSTGPNSFAVSGFNGGNSVSMGPNSFGESDGIAVLLDEDGGLAFLWIEECKKEKGIGLRDVNRFSGIKIVSPMPIFFGCSSGLALAMAFQFFTLPVYHCAMWDRVSSDQRILCE